MPGTGVVADLLGDLFSVLSSMAWLVNRASRQCDEPNAYSWWTDCAQKELCPCGEAAQGDHQRLAKLANQALVKLARRHGVKTVPRNLGRDVS